MLRPSSQGGSNYAEGGAVTRPPLDPLFNTADQLATYLNATGGRADGNGLYLHWVGANDVAARLTAVSTSVAAATAQVKALLAAGAGAVIVPTVPPLGETPLMMQAVLGALGPASEAALAEQLYRA
ncbi:autotransporter outer membrane beta-barrel domain-containing protein|uniref:SGNH/GDSL hydrolase family protein n=1 Tax=Candidatus Pantoea persica TaxID=2518128 RepID=UPI0035A90746|nr:autotransporter outer membrane beta-barrel domain-containing protein [Candidatus Pantoea persica]